MLERARMSLRALLLRRRLEREMQEEMAEHLERATARLRSRGMPEAEARRAARREFGNVGLLQEQARDARGWSWLEALAADARFARRQFARRPVTTLVMFVVLAVGMAISTILFSALHSMATQPPMGIQRADDLVRIRGIRYGSAGRREFREFGEEELGGYRALTNAFVSVAGWTDDRMALDAGDDPARRGLDARVTFATENYFSVLGARPVLGAGLPADPRHAAVALLGYAAWEQLFGKSPSVIGSTVRVAGVPVTIVGVAPERFNGVGQYTRFQLWMPLEARRLFLPARAPELQAVARTRRGVDLEEATAAVRVVAARAAAADHELSAVRPSTDVIPLRVGNTDPGSDQDMNVATFIVSLLGLLVLLVTCANVSALLTGLATARRQEIAVRLSMGADRSRIIRQLLTESGVLSMTAAATSLALVFLLLRTVTRNMPTLTVELAITWQAAAFTFGIALAVGIVFGLAPALHATRLALGGVLRDSSSSIVAARARLQRALVVAQVGLTQPLIVLVTGVLVLVFGGQQLVTVGDYQPQQRSARADRVITLFVPPPSGAQRVGSETDTATRSFRLTMDRLAERLRGTAGIDAVVPEWQAAPLGSYVVHPDDRTAAMPATAVRLEAARAVDGYFAMTGISLLRGRALERSDTVRAGARSGELPAVIGADLARRLWGGVDAIGRRLRPASDSATAMRTLVVVGVFDDGLAERSRGGSDSRIFVPPASGDFSAMLLVRTAGLAEQLVPTVQRVAQEVAPAQVVRTRTLLEIEEANRRVNRIMVGGVLAAGAAALLLSAIGLYAVVAFSVGQRGREIAVRMAFGARGGQILRQFLTDGLRLSGIGLLLGLPVGLAGLFMLMSLDPSFWPAVVLPSVAAIASLGVLLVAAAASWIPARRAAAVQPAVTLRGE